MYIRRADGGLRYYDAQQFVVITSDPSQAYVRGIEVESGKEDTTQLTIAVWMETCWILSKSLGAREPKCECVCVQVRCPESSKKKKFPTIGGLVSSYLKCCSKKVHHFSVIVFLKQVLNYKIIHMYTESEIVILTTKMSNHDEVLKEVCVINVHYLASGL